MIAGSAALPIASRDRQISGGGFALTIGASGLDATLVNQKPDQAIHRVTVSAADECRYLTLLRDQISQDQSMQMMGECRTSTAELFLQTADRETSVKGTAS